MPHFLANQPLCAADSEGNCFRYILEYCDKNEQPEVILEGFRDGEAVESMRVGLMKLSVEYRVDGGGSGS